jgi:lipopolysaccharide/colanic/teichoic acid biosynthesis glycosyltransferase/carbonic anhydrase/acetyltransferase-like protein (isoleucine patch superfamily)
VLSDRIATITFDGLSESCWFDNNGDTIIAVPEQWHVESLNHHRKLVYYSKNVLACSNAGRNHASWLILSNGRYVTNVDYTQFSRILANLIPISQKEPEIDHSLNANLIAVNIDPMLQPYREKVRITSGGNVAGFRRLYSIAALPASVPTNWPHHIFIKHSVLDKVLVNGELPLDFGNFASQCISNSLSFRSVRIGGTVLDLETEAGLLRFLVNRLDSMPRHSPCLKGHNCKISTSARIFGKIALGNNTHIGDNTVIVGPTILGDNVKVAPNTVIRASVIGPDLSIAKGSFVQNCILVRPKSQHKSFSCYNNIGVPQFSGTNQPFVKNEFIHNNFHIWPRFSYVRFVKRIADIAASLVVFVLFLPIFPVIALAIKLSSRGPIFFKDKRQGLYAREFYCLKFRTMIIGSEKIQGKLRFKNQVDGPQFKIKNDPRITVVGRFLRDTFIDEIPQFINILFGQMSVVGPRPSPKTENSTCPVWRDARLSVRPGITGLWQICRTRRRGHDFQEWIHYDTKYIRNLSLRLDLWICWQTIKKLIINFINQF